MSGLQSSVCKGKGTAVRCIFIVALSCKSSFALDDLLYTSCRHAEGLSCYIIRSLSVVNIVNFYHKELVLHPVLTT